MNRAFVGQQKYTPHPPEGQSTTGSGSSTLATKGNGHGGDNHERRKKMSIDGYVQSKIDDAMDSYRKYAGEGAYRQSTK